MTDKERLEEIKNKKIHTITETDYIQFNDIRWLIEQAERAESNAKEWVKSDRKLNNYRDVVKLKDDEIERYKQALEFYADSQIYKEMTDPSGVETEAEKDEGDIARQALEVISHE